MISFSLSGSTSNTSDFLKKLQSQELYSSLDRIAQKGVAALQAATPVESGLTGSSWGYEINDTKSGIEIVWTNTHIVDGVNVAVILQYGHGTGTGGYVSGQDYINPAIQPIFDEIANEVWKKVTAS